MRTLIGFAVAILLVFSHSACKILSEGISGTGGIPSNPGGGGGGGSVFKTIENIMGVTDPFGFNNGSAGEARYALVYGLTTDGTDIYVSDNYNKVIRRVNIATGAASTLVGSPFIAGSIDGIGSAARFNNITGLVYLAGNLYVCDSTDETIRKVDLSTNQVTTFAGSVGNTGTADGAGAAASFNTPYAITTDGTDLFVVDQDNYTIRRIVVGATEGTVSTFAGIAGATGTTDGAYGVNRLRQPYGITYDAGKLYIVERSNAHVVRELDIGTQIISTVAGSWGVQNHLDGLGLAANLYTPNAITTDGTYLYVSEYYGYTIRKIQISNWDVTTLAGRVQEWGATDGFGAAAMFKNIRAVLHYGGYVYVGSEGDALRRIDPTTGEVVTWSGQPGSEGRTDGPVPIGQIRPINMAALAGDHIYFSERWTSVVRRLDITDGSVTTIAGVTGGHLDAVGLDAKFNAPRGFYSYNGLIYVADEGNKVIRTIDSASLSISTLAGTIGGSGTATGGLGVGRFNSPFDVVVANGKLYVTDCGNDAIREVDLSTGVISDFVGTPGGGGGHQ